MSNAAASAQVWEMAKRIRAISGLGEKAAPDVALVVRAELERTIRDGTTPDGEPWKLRADTGEKPLQDAAAHLYVAAVKDVVYVRLVGIEASHHRGATRGRIKRQVIPTGTHLPDRMAVGIHAALTKHFEREVAGG